MLYPFAANDILAMWGQIAAIILLVQLFFFVLLALAFNTGMTFLFSWVRQKAELVKKLHPMVDSLNSTTRSAISGTPSPEDSHNKIVQIVAQVPAQVHKIDEKVEQGAERVNQFAIEVRARTMMVQHIAKVFLLPGLVRRERLAAQQIPGYKGSAYVPLAEQVTPRLPVGTTTNGHKPTTPRVSSERRKDAVPR